jgi:dTDP-4-dehydrorhamnose 3,5-epimerase
MRFAETTLRGAAVIEMEQRADERGSFARAWCATEMAAAGLNANIAQVNFSHNERAGTLRGLHMQRDPHAETKIIRCIRGAMYDVVVDLRPESASFCRWFGIELSAANRLALYVPEGFAHGYQTLADDSEVLYQVSVPYAPAAEEGYRYDDPAFSVTWPLAVSAMSEKDRDWPEFASVLALSGG